MFNENGTMVIAKRRGIGTVRNLIDNAEKKGLSVQEVTPWDLELAAQVELTGDLILVDQIERIDNPESVIEVVRRSQRAGKKVVVVSNDSGYGNRTRQTVLNRCPEMRKAVFA